MTTMKKRCRHSVVQFPGNGLVWCARCGALKFRAKGRRKWMLPRADARIGEKRPT